MEIHSGSLSDEGLVVPDAGDGAAGTGVPVLGLVGESCGELCHD